MAGSVNKVILIGNLGADPEIRSTQDGRPVANLRVATTESWRDKNFGRAARADRVAPRRHLQRGPVPDCRAISEEGLEGLPRRPASDPQMGGSERAGALHHRSGAAGLQLVADHARFTREQRFRRLCRIERQWRQFRQVGTDGFGRLVRQGNRRRNPVLGLRGLYCAVDRRRPAPFTSIRLPAKTHGIIGNYDSGELAVRPDVNGGRDVGRFVERAALYADGLGRLPVAVPQARSAFRTEEARDRPSAVGDAWPALQLPLEPAGRRSCARSPKCRRRMRIASGIRCSGRYRCLAEVR